MVGAGDKLAFDVQGGTGEEKTPPESIARAITVEDLEQKSNLTATNEFALNKGIAYNEYLEHYTGLRDRILDAVMSAKVRNIKGVDGWGTEKIIGMALAANQQPQTNVNIGESFTKKLGGG